MLTLFEILAVLFFLTAAFAWLNCLFLRLPQTIGLLVMGLGASLIREAIEAVFPSVVLERQLADYVGSLDLGDALLNGVLAFLVFGRSNQHRRAVPQGEGLGSRCLGRLRHGCNDAAGGRRTVGTGPPSRRVTR